MLKAGHLVCQSMRQSAKNYGIVIQYFSNPRDIGWSPVVGPRAAFAITRSSEALRANHELAEGSRVRVFVFVPRTGRS